MTEDQRKKKGTADDIDKHVGKQLRSRRTLMSMSQEKLASAIGVTFQQIQKYERGTNRVSASRLFRFSKILDVPVDYFYRDMDDLNSDVGTSALGMSDNKQEEFDGAPNKPSMPDDIMTRKESLDLLRAYYSVANEKKRREMLSLVRSMAKNLT